MTKKERDNYSEETKKIFSATYLYYRLDPHRKRTTLRFLVLSGEVKK